LAKKKRGKKKAKPALKLPNVKPSKVKSKSKANGSRKYLIYAAVIVLILLVIYFGSRSSSQSSPETNVVKENALNSDKAPTTNSNCKGGHVYDGADCISLSLVEECGPLGHAHGSSCHCDNGASQTVVDGRKVCTIVSPGFFDQGTGKHIASPRQTNPIETQGVGRCINQCMRDSRNATGCKERCGAPV